MTVKRDRRASRLCACVVVLFAASCGDDDGNACLPAQVRGTCVEEVSREGTSCFEPEGKCTWQTADGGLTFEWQNGARMEYQGFLLPDQARIFGSDGQLCSETTRLDNDTCKTVGYHNAAGGDWVDTCIRGTAEKPEGIHYTCKNGSEYDVKYRADLVNTAACSKQGPDILRCVDEDGVRFGDQ